MLSKLRPRSVYDVAAALSLFIALGGTAYAVAANSIGTAQLKKGAVTNPKLANGAVRNAKIVKGAVTGKKVADKSLTGADINASTLPGSEPWHVLAPGSLGGANCDGRNNRFCSGLDISFQGYQWRNRPNASGEDYNTVAYYRDRAGIVRLKGFAQCVDSGLCSRTESHIFILPSGYRPPHTMFLPARAAGDNQHYVEIRSDGGVYPDGTAAVNTYVLLDGLSFRCGPAGANGCK